MYEHKDILKATLDSLDSILFVIDEEGNFIEVLGDKISKILRIEDVSDKNIQDFADKYPKSIINFNRCLKEGGFSVNVKFAGHPIKMYYTRLISENQVFVLGIMKDNTLFELELQGLRNAVEENKQLIKKLYYEKENERRKRKEIEFGLLYKGAGLMFYPLGLLYMIFTTDYQKIYKTLKWIYDLFLY